LTVRRARVQCAVEYVATGLKLPAGSVIVGCQMNPERVGVLELIVEHPSLTAVAEGDFMPVVTVLVQRHESQFKKVGPGGFIVPHPPLQGTR